MHLFGAKNGMRRKGNGTMRLAHKNSLTVVGVVEVDDLAPAVISDDVDDGFVVVWPH